MNLNPRRIKNLGSICARSVIYGVKLMVRQNMETTRGILYLMLGKV